MTNTIELKVIMYRKKITIKKLAGIIGVSATTLSYKINNEREFTSSEIMSIQKALNLSDAERNDIFFYKQC